MCVCVCVGVIGKLLADEIDVKSGLRQCHTMAPVLLKLYACIGFEWCLLLVADADGVGTLLLYEFDKKPFRTFSTYAYESPLANEQFVDDAVLLTTSLAGAE